MVAYCVLTNSAGDLNNHLLNHLLEFGVREKKTMRSSHFLIFYCMIFIPEVA